MKIIGYSLYTLCLAVWLMYARFPGDFFGDYLEQQVNTRTNKLHLGNGPVHPAFPFGVTIDSPMIALRDNTQKSFFQADSITVRPLLTSIIRRIPAAAFSGAALGGTLNGKIIMENMERGKLNVELAANGIALGDFAYLGDMLGRDISGILTGELQLRLNSPGDNAGSGSLHLRDVVMELVVPVISLHSIAVDQVTISFDIKNSVIPNVKIVIAGSEMEGELNGRIQFAANLMQSTLNIDGDVNLLPEFFKRYPDAQKALRAVKRSGRENTIKVFLTGTLAKPEVRLT